MILAQNLYKLYKLVEHLDEEDRMETEMRLVAHGTALGIRILVAGIHHQERQFFLVTTPGAFVSQRADEWFKKSV